MHPEENARTQKRPEAEQPAKRRSGMAYLLHLAGRYRLHLALSALFSVMSALCSFVPFVMVYQVLLFLIEGNADAGAALQYGIIAAVAIVGKFAFAIASGACSHIGAFNTLYQVRAQISRHIAKVNLGFFDQTTSGALKKVIIEDVERIEKFLAHQIPDIVAAACTPAIMFSYLLTLNVPMALGMLVPVVLGVAVQLFAMAATGKQMPTYHRLLAKLNAAIMQFINGMPVMKAYRLDAKGYREYADAVTEYNEFWKQCTKSQGYSYGVFVAIVESGILFVLPLGGVLYLQGSLSAADYLFFMIMSMVFLSSLLNLLTFAMTFNQIMSGMERIQDIMDLPEASEGTLALDPAKPHAVAFDHVTFGYGAAETNALTDVSLDLPAGSLTAFVGPSGAGKTTAAQLIPKFWETRQGAVRIDGHALSELRTDNLMDLVSFVFQEAFMLDDTLYENIRLGRPNATREQVEAAARAAQIHDTIEGLPNGYDTLLGENGVKLSGGERQRVCIARAILKDAPIIVFDEATSFTDIENEHRIQLALSHLLTNKTCIMIAHRLHTIVHADQICVFDHGRLRERGTHDSLIKQDGAYARMWDAYTHRTEKKESLA